VSRANALFAIIGTTWASTLNRRENDSRDYVRLEIESALGLSIPIVPILLGDVEMPLPEELPGSIANLVFMHGFRLNLGRVFFDDINRLISDLKAAYM
jgi:hypothetical protein